jgi:hypothetical protein
MMRLSSRQALTVTVFCLLIVPSSPSGLPAPWSPVRTGRRGWARYGFWFIPDGARRLAGGIDLDRIDNPKTVGAKGHFEEPPQPDHRGRRAGQGL